MRPAVDILTNSAAFNREVEYFTHEILALLNGESLFDEILVERATVAAAVQTNPGACDSHFMPSLDNWTVMDSSTTLASMQCPSSMMTASLGELQRSLQALQSATAPKDGINCLERVLICLRHVLAEFKKECPSDGHTLRLTRWLDGIGQYMLALTSLSNRMRSILVDLDVSEPACMAFVGACYAAVELFTDIEAARLHLLFAVEDPRVDTGMLVVNTIQTFAVTFPHIHVHLLTRLLDDLSAPIVPSDQEVMSAKGIAAIEATCLRLQLVEQLAISCIVRPCPPILLERMATVLRSSAYATIQEYALRVAPILSARV